MNIVVPSVRHTAPLCLVLLSTLAGCLHAAEPPARSSNYVQESPHNYGPWRSSVLGSGGYLQHVVDCPTNPRRFFMTTDVGGFYRSDDGGQSWQMLHGRLPARSGNYEVRGLIVDPRSDRHITIATGGPYGSPEGIFVSQDGGESWKQTLTARFVGNGATRWAGRVLVRSPHNPDILWCAAVGDGVYKSLDNGQSWQKSGGAELYPNDLVVDRANPNRMWLTTSGGTVKGVKYSAGFFRTLDGGATWSAVAGPVPVELVQDPKDAGLLYGIFQNAYIRRSTDGGTTWQEWSVGLPVEAPVEGKGKPSISKSTYRAITAGPDFLLTCNTRDADFFKLPAGGDKWEPVLKEKVETGDWYGARNNWFFGAAAGSITVSNANPAHWFMTDYFALWQTTDAGKNWRLTIDGVEMTVLHCLAQDATDPNVVHAGAADVGAFTSRDGGRRFLRSKVPNQGKDRDGGGNMKCIDVSPRDANFLYAVGNRNSDGGWAANQVFLSTDRGQTWTRSAMGGLPNMNTQRCTTIVADVQDRNTAYLTVAGTIRPNWGGVYKSTDGGQNWTWISAGMPEGKYGFPYEIWAHGRQLAVDGQGTLVAISQSENKVYRLDRQTGTWTNSGLRTKGKFWSVVADRKKEGRFFVGAQDDGLYRSEDAGATWKKVYDKAAPYVVTDLAVANRVAAGTGNGVILSLDGGETWKELDKALPYRTNNIPAFAGERLLVGSGGSGIFWMPLSPAG